MTIRDHGPGIDPADLPHIFDRFYRAPAARGLPGSGLGLAIVAQVAEAEQGYVTADNAPDGGAIFMLSLPEIPALSESDDSALDRWAPVDDWAPVHDGSRADPLPGQPQAGDQQHQEAGAAQRLGNGGASPTETNGIAGMIGDAETSSHDHERLDAHGPVPAGPLAPIDDGTPVDD